MKRTLRACGHYHPEFADGFRLYAERKRAALTTLIDAGADLRTLAGKCALQLELMVGKPGPAQGRLFA